MGSMRWSGWVGLLVIGCTPFTGGQGGGSGSVAESSGDGGSTTAATNPTTNATDPSTSTAVDTTDTTITTTITTTASSDSGEPEAFYRREVVIHGDQVPGDQPLLDFTVLVSFAGEEGMRHVDSGGHVLELDAADLVFRDADEQPLARERVSYAPSTGRFSFWVRVPEVAGDADTTLYLDYGAPSLVGLSPAGAWNDAYVGVWHFEDAVVDGGAVLDSSAQGTHGTAVDMNAGDGVAGRVGQGLSFTQPNAAVWFDAGALDLPGPLTFEGWARMDASLADSGYQRLFNKGGELNRPLSLWVGDATVTFGEAAFVVNYEELVDYVELLYSVPGFAYGQWHHYAGVVVGPGNEVVLFVDGQRRQSTTFADSIDTGYPNLYFGNWDIMGSSRAWNGVLDEFRFSDVARTDEWIEMAYRTQAMTTTVTTVGAEQALP